MKKKSFDFCAFFFQIAKQRSLGNNMINSQYLTKELVQSWAGQDCLPGEFFCRCFIFLFYTCYLALRIHFNVYLFRRTFRMQKFGNELVHRYKEFPSRILIVHLNSRNVWTVKILEENSLYLWTSSLSNFCILRNFRQKRCVRTWQKRYTRWYRNNKKLFFSCAQSEKNVSD